jgi:hypothetical protein
MRFYLIPIDQSFMFPVHLVTQSLFYTNYELKKVNAFYNTRRSRMVSSVLHDNASSHKSETVKSSLASEIVKIINHRHLSIDFSPCDFFLFPRPMKILSDKRYTSCSSFASAFFQCRRHNYSKRILFFSFSKLE